MVIAKFQYITSMHLVLYCYDAIPIYYKYPLVIRLLFQYVTIIHVVILLIQYIADLVAMVILPCLYIGTAVVFYMALFQKITPDMLTTCMMLTLYMDI